MPVAGLGFVRAVVRDAGNEIAQTQPLRLAADGRIDNPYPAAGVWVKGQTHNHTDTAPWAASQLPKFRLAYQEKGEAAAFSVDYSYWESPYQWLPSDGTPQVLGVTPGRVAADGGREIEIRGVNFGGRPAVRIGAAAAEVLRAAPDLLKVRLPAGLAPGRYDVAVDNERFRGTLAFGLTVSEPQAALAGWSAFTPAEGLAHRQCLAVACPGEQVWVGHISGPVAAEARGLEQRDRGHRGALDLRPGGCPRRIDLGRHRQRALAARPRGQMVQAGRRTGGEDRRQPVARALGPHGLRRPGRSVGREPLERRPGSLPRRGLAAPDEG